MNEFDKIIGYSSVKLELKQICDALKNTEIYEQMGVSAPRGLLLHGEPGVGKSLMASVIIEASGRKAFICRKDQPNGDFVKKIKATFDKAVENAPSIVYLDDMDKFANEDESHPDAEEYVTVQSCIDDVKKKQVFVLATANNIWCLPYSLYRAGRFDRVIKIEAPQGEDAVKIISHYLMNKNVSDDIDAKTIASMMSGHSCATLETVINEAGLYAGYERSDSVTLKHFLTAYLRNIHNASLVLPDDNQVYAEGYTVLFDPNNILSQVIYHEAGHAVINEILNPESTALISICNINGKQEGFVISCSDLTKTSLFQMKYRILVALGGSASTEQKFGLFDAGGANDLRKAFNMINSLVTEFCSCGFHLHTNEREDSQHLRAEQEQVVSSEVEKYYRKAKEILSKNSDFLDKVAIALKQKGFLTGVDIQEIKARSSIVSVEI